MCAVISVVSNSAVRGLQPSRVLYPWDFLGKNPGGGCHGLLQRIFPLQGLNPRLLCLLNWQAGSLPLAWEVVAQDDNTLFLFHLKNKF